MPRPIRTAAIERDVPDLATLRKISSRSLVAPLGPGDRVRLTLLVDSPQRARLESAVSRHARACGCGVGAAALLLAATVIVVLRFGLHQDLRVAGIPGAATAISAAVTVSLLAKILVLLHARYQLARLYTAVSRELGDQR